ncbi:outer membrane usher protein [Pseudomonas sp. 3296]|uniref:fimbria/pilus outer membrane usher protein n=1 Tax=Pseudomonas sp. 3296 TaxID=2817753 RepID=UPI00285F728E|nr:fimbria/pilus outer membrane usher protein [Pseudomonas sp. 3296]MDR6915975.1 outer membrane usher protein [Pseudomonas sp. 3296]
MRIRQPCLANSSQRSAQPSRLSHLRLAVALGIVVPGFAGAVEGESGGPVTFNTSFIQGLGQPADLKQFIEGNSVLPGTYRVDIYVNRSLSGRQDITFLKQDDGDVTPCLTLTMLRQFGVDIDRLIAEGTLSAYADLDSCVDVKALIPQFVSEYEANFLRLYLSVPQAMMSRSARGYVDPALWDEGVAAAFVDYGLNTSRRKNDYSTTDSLSANLRNGLNIGPWRLRNESSYSKSTASPGLFNSNRTYAQRDITSLRSQLTVGQTYSDSEIFDSVRYKGAQLGSDLAMLPDSERGYAPVIRGVANSNATVEVKQNGFSLYTTTVSAGPFELTDIYPSGSNGDLEITITEADGQVRSFTQSFASLPILVRRGAFRYNLDLGQFDALNEDADSPLFGTGNLVYGLTDNMSTFGGLMLSDGFSATNIGAGFNTPAGAISVDATQSSSSTRLGKNIGQSLRFLYSKTLNLTGTTFTLAGYRYSTEGYRTFSEHVDDENREPDERVRGRAKARFNLTANQVLGDGFGSLYLSASDQTYWNLPGQTRTLQAGYSNHWGRANYSFDVTHTRFADSQSAYPSQGNTRSRDAQATFSLSFPLGDDARAPRASFSAAHDASGTNSRANIGGYVAGRDDLNFSLGGSRGVTGEYSGDGQINAKTPYASLGAGYSQGRNYKTANLSARGSVVAHGGGVNFGQPVGETFTLAQVEDTPGVQVGRYAGVKTGSNGYAIIPNTQPYRGNFVSLNTQDLGADIELESTSQQVIPRRGAITKATFKAKSGMRMEATFNYPAGKVPFGAIVEDEEGQQLAIVDPRQTALLLVEKNEGTLVVKWADQRCTAQYAMSEKVAGENYQSKILTCQ